MIAKLYDVLSDYSDELLVEQDLALWMFAIMNWAILGVLFNFTASEHSLEQSNVETIGYAFELGLWGAVIVAFGRPLLYVGIVRIGAWLGYEATEESA